MEAKAWTTNSHRHGQLHTQGFSDSRKRVQLECNQVAATVELPPSSEQCVGQMRYAFGLEHEPLSLNTSDC